jgi:Tn3 transposase DDE domain
MQSACRARRRRSQREAHRFPVERGVAPGCLHLERAISTLLSLGKDIPEILLPHLSPLGWEHINLMGDYVWHANRRVVKGGFRGSGALIRADSGGSQELSFMPPAPPSISRGPPRQLV